MIDGLAVNESIFSPVIVFIIDWALSRGLLDKAIKEEQSFIEAIENLRAGKLSFVDFVFDVMDTKLPLETFSEEITQFIKDYFEYDGYFDDLLKSYEISNLWFLPHDFSAKENFYKQIDTSLANYTENKRHHPKLILFQDPLEVEKYRDEYREHEKSIE